MKTRHIRPLTGLRGIAAWWVCLHHYREVLPTTGMVGHLLQMTTAYGYLAVDLFFILSGFVIHLSYGPMFTYLNWEKIRYFAVARFARIYPLYIVITCLFLANPIAILLFSRSVETGPRYDIRYFLLSLVLAQNWGFTREIAWNGAAWSISTELVAYLIFPALSICIAKFLQRQVSTLTAILATLLCIAAFFDYMSADTLGSDIAHLGLTRCLLEFGVGMLISRLYQFRGPPGSLFQTTLVVASTLGIITLMATNVPDYYILPAAFSALIFSFTRPQGWVVTLLGGPFLVFLGEISYAVYLVHSLVKDWINFLLVRQGIPLWLPGIAYVTLVALSAVALHWFVELPARYSVLRWASRHWNQADTSSGRGDRLWRNQPQKPVGSFEND